MEDFTILEETPQVVSLNVGGQLFLTGKSTLLKAEKSRIARMFRGDEVLQKVGQTSPVYFIDRDPTHFQRVLNFLRNGSCTLPRSREERQELLVEAQYYQLDDLAAELTTSLDDYANAALSFDFESMVLQHHARTGKLESCISTLLTFVKDSLVKITPVSEVSSDNQILVIWLSASMPPAEPSHIVFRYRGVNESNEVGTTVAKGTPEFADWNRLWDVWPNKELMNAFRKLAGRHGLKVQCNSRNECFKDNVLDVKWKMYRVRCLSLSIGAAATK